MTPLRARQRCRQAASVLIESLESRTLLSANVLGKLSLGEHMAALAPVHLRQVAEPARAKKSPAPVKNVPAPVTTTTPAPVVANPDPVTAPAPATDPAPVTTAPVTTAPTTTTTPTVASSDQTLPLAPSVPVAAASNGNPVYADPRADLNGDGIVDILDYTMIAIHWQQTGTPGTLVGDVNGDGVVNTLDANIVAANWQLQVAPPVNNPPPVQYDWHQQIINGIVNVWAPNPSDFGTTFAVTDPNALFGSDGTPQVESVHQGGAADCYLLAAEGSIALQNPNKIKTIVQNDPAGGWEVTFQNYSNVTGTYVPLVIHTDDELSSTWQIEENGEVWNLVIEKAYAAFRTWNGSTGTNTMVSLDWGYAGNAMTALGEANSTVYLSSNQQAVYNLIQTELAAHLPIDMHTTAAAPTMVASHVYIITGVHTDANGTLWVTTYNPWGFYDTRTVADLLANSVGSLVVGTV